MAQNDSVDKMALVNPAPAGRREFLSALYTGSPEHLYLELRCIHPETGEVRTLWGQMGNKRELSAVLKHSEVLNKEGFGIYFAPCLRKTKQGKAEAAALVPALWIDIDGDPQQRDQDLERLRSFTPAPSFILNSGGGWHGYWLLDKAFLLDTEADRQRIAAILRGLFAALGGDPAYVKTAAGIMRLPDSVNTKPERQRAVVTLIESHPVRRYPLDVFAWLESHSQPLPKDANRGQGVLQNGDHPLPPRTEAYLASGAPLHQRNTELFAAACQYRDAGHSQSETERELIPRYVADGCPEKEGLKTIASVYSRPPREPIGQRPEGLAATREIAREQVSQLVSQYRRDTDEKVLPSVDQIRDAVEACATLNPLEWAQERKRLKEICGDAFRIEDLNGMYKQARRDLEYQSQAETPNSPRYIEMDGHMVFEKPTERGLIRQTVAEWSGRVLEWVTQKNDDGEADHVMRLQLRHPKHTTTLDIPSEMFGDANGLQKFIAQKGGGIYAACAGMHRHLTSAILKLSGDFPTRQTYRFVGWTQVDNKWLYVSPGMSLGSEGVLAASPEVDLENRLHDYGLKQADWDTSLAAFEAALTVLPKSLIPVLTAFALLPVLQRFLPTAAPKPALHLVGTTGSGKSEIASLLTSFYGHFTRDAPPAQWGDTVNTVEALGYALADALYWVDDYKSIYADERTFTRFLQSYSRGMGRGRLTREAKVRQDRACRGLLLSTGETTIEGEASVLSRMLVLEVPPWEKRDPGGAALAQVEALRSSLSGFTAHFIQWIAAQADEGTLSKELAAHFEVNTISYQEMLRGRLGKQAHTGRMVQNWAVLMTVYQMLRKFLRGHDANYALPEWQDALLQTVQVVQQERAGQVFIDAIEQLLASGEVMLARDLRHPEEPRPGTTLIGYQDDQFVYLIPEVAYRAVGRVQSLKFTSAAIGSQLKEDGLLITNASDVHLGVQIRVRGARVRVWRLKGDIFGGGAGANGDSIN